MLGFLKRKNEAELFSPLSGEIMDITEVPDEVFSQKMVGDGIAINPSEGLVTSPCNGKVVQIFSTNHAIGIHTLEGLDILIHLGLDTVELKGEGFFRLIETGAEVKIGDPLIKMDLDKIAALGKSVITLVIITNPDRTKEIRKEAGIVTASKSRIMTVTLKRKHID